MIHVTMIRLMLHRPELAKTQFKTTLLANLVVALYWKSHLPVKWQFSGDRRLR